MTSTALKCLIGAAGMAMLCSHSPALADEDMGSLTGSVALTSDYRFRGMSQNDTDPAPQFGLTWNAPEGFYVGSWISKINFNDGPSGAGVASHNSGLEWDIYAGKYFDLDGTDLNVQAVYYAYPDHARAFGGLPRYSMFEAQIGLSHNIDQLTIGGTFAWSPDFFGETGNGYWIGGTASYAMNDWISFSGNIGRQWVSDLNNAGTGFPYTHWDLGVTASWNDFSLDLRYIDTSVGKSTCTGFNGPRNNWCGPTVVATVSYAFTLFE